MTSLEESATTEHKKGGKNMTSSEKILLLEVCLGTNSFKKKMQKAGLLGLVSSTVSTGTEEQKLEVFEKVSRFM